MRLHFVALPLRSLARRFAGSSGVDVCENISAVQYAVELQPSRAVILCFEAFSH